MDEYVDLVKMKLEQYLGDRKFTGKILFTFNCRSGGIGGISLEVRQEFQSRDLPTHGRVVDKAT